MRNKLLLLFILCLNFSAVSFSQVKYREEYIAKYKDLAIREMARSGIPASIILAQGCLESGDGRGKLALASNNHFGIKCKSDWTGESVSWDDDERGECFRSYPTVEESYIDHSRFLINSPRYAELFKLDKTDYKAWAKGLKKAGYATAEGYDKQLIKIIEDFGLYKLDHKMTRAEMAKYENLKVEQVDTKGLAINPYKRHPVEKRNRLKTVVIRPGDTFESIAEEFGLEEWEICKMNDYPKDYVPKKNEIIYIESKRRNPADNTAAHQVGQGETMHFISQVHGLKLRPLLKRNGMRQGDEPKPGQVVYLRKKKG
jgi:LysM repeat protein